MSSDEDILLISDQAVVIHTWIVYTVVCQLISMFGVVTNIINIICFTKLGFEDTANISLLGLTLSDFCISVTMIVLCVVVTPALTAADLPYDSFEVTYLAIFIPYLSFGRVSTCITAMITLERCLCITAPLKVKSIITPKRSTIATAVIFITFFCSGAPVWTVNSLGMTFSALKNKTLIGIVPTEDRESVEMSSFIVNNFCIPLVAFMIIVTCTAILSFKLRSQSKWRQNSSSLSSRVDTVSIRNQKAAKMVVMISALFIVCFIPICTLLLTVAFVPDLSVNRKYFNLTLIITGLSHVMENINSSMNIFIYYRMSSKYKEIFQKVFCLRNRSTYTRWHCKKWRNIEHVSEKSKQ